MEALRKDKKPVKSPFTKFTRELQKDVIDSDTGEVLSSSSEKEGIVPKEPNFIKLYLADISYLNSLPKWTNSILYELLKKMNYEGEIVINMGIKKRIAAELGINVATIKNALTMYNKKNILIRQEEGIYLANPWLFGRGDWKEIRQIRLTVKYNLDGTRDLQADIEKEEKEIQEVN